MVNEFIMKSEFHIVFLNWDSFPNGMAATQRIRLLAKALSEDGVRVSVYCLRAYEIDPSENPEIKGRSEGIYFEYTTGTNLRARRFLIRRWLELKGDIVAIYKIISLKLRKDIDGIYLWSTIQNITLEGMVYRFLAWILNTPLIIEINERPWSLKSKPNILEKIISPFSGVNGAVIISNFLYEWAKGEAKRNSRNINLIYVPILADVEESNLIKQGNYRENKDIIFAGSPYYDSTIAFILKAMNIVWKKYPDCKLKITGGQLTNPATKKLEYEIFKLGITNNVNILGYLRRQELLELYKSSQALLIPLFNDVRSKARFPTKLGEYLLSCRPVVTTKVGEVARYLFDEDNAYLSEPDSPELFGNAIIRVLDNQNKASSIGRNGSLTAQKVFNYKNWSKPLGEFVREFQK